MFRLLQSRNRVADGSHGERLSGLLFNQGAKWFQIHRGLRRYVHLRNLLTFEFLGTARLALLAKYRKAPENQYSQKAYGTASSRTSRGLHSGQNESAAVHAVSASFCISSIAVSV